MKRAVLLIAALAAVLAVVPAVQCDAGTAELGDGASYTYRTWGSDFSTYRATLDSVDTSDEVLFISTTLEGYNVTEISPSAVSGSCLRAAVVPERVVRMGADVFSGCPELERVYFMGPMPEHPGDLVPEGAEVLCREGMPGWPDGTARMASVSSSGGCTVEAVVIEGTAVVVGGTPDGDGTVAVPERIGGFPVGSVGAYAFAGKDNASRTGVDPRTDVSEVVLPEGLTEIRERAFFYCSGLGSAVLPDSLEVIRDEAFRVASSLSSADMPEGLRYIGFEAFRQCGSLPEVVIPDTVAFVGEGAFKICDGAKRLVVGEGMDTAPPWAFAYMRSLESAEFRGQLDSVGEQAFYMCGSLESADLSGVTGIGDEAFMECGSLSSVALGDSLVSVGAGAFTRCGSLAELHVPDTVTQVGDKAFAYCASLSDIFFAGPMPEFGASVFLNDDVTVHAVPEHSGSWSSFGGDLVVDDAGGSGGVLPFAAVAAAAAVLVIAVLVLLRRRA